MERGWRRGRGCGVGCWARRRRRAGARRCASCVRPVRAPCGHAGRGATAAWVGMGGAGGGGSLCYTAVRWQIPRRGSPQPPTLTLTLTLTLTIALSRDAEGARGAAAAEQCGRPFAPAEEGAAAAAAAAPREEGDQARTEVQAPARGEGQYRRRLGGRKVRQRPAYGGVGAVGLLIGGHGATACSPWHLGLQPLAPRVAASNTCCRVQHA